METTEKYKDAVKEIRDKSSELLDKRIYMMSSGGIALLATLETQMRTHESCCFFYISAVFFLLSLLTNMYSHLDVIKRAERLLNKNVVSTEYVKKDNCIIKRINYISIAFLILGIITALINIANR